MKTTDGWIDIYINFQWSFKKLIEEVQKEAWNESILLSASSAEVSYDSDMSGRHYRVSKQSILKNLIP